MLLDRLRIRGKLLILVLGPLIAVLGLGVFGAATQAAQADRAARVAQVAQVAATVGRVAQELQEERLFSVGLLLGRIDASELDGQVRLVADLIGDARTDLAGVASPSALAALSRLDSLSQLRGQIQAGTATLDQVYGGYTSLINDLLGGLRLTDSLDTATPSGRQLAALDSLMLIDEANSEQAALLALGAGGGDDSVVHRFLRSQSIEETAAQQFLAFATDDERALYRQVTKAFKDRVGPEFFEALAGGEPLPAFGRLSLPRLFPLLESFDVLGRFVERTVTAEVSAAVAAERQARLAAVSVSVAIAALVPLLVIGLGLAISTDIARSMRRLTSSANRVAKAAEDELARVADDEAEQARPLRLDRVQVAARDEIGELARAFDRIQLTSAALVERQTLSRRNIAQMFGHIGRRTQNLVGRQLDLIDNLEYRETDPDRLGELYRLDHLSSRLRRSASSLVVLSGLPESGQYRGPLELADVVRLALAEIENYTRIDIDAPPGMTVAPAMIDDLVLMLAELMENATTFSAPHTRVMVSARPNSVGVRLTITDHGIGLSPQRLAEENSRLARRERLDLAPTELLGLFVVGRLARRLGAVVRLSGTVGGGITATADFGPSLLVAAAAGPAAVRQTSIPELDQAVLDRANRTLRNGSVWNAFAAAPRAAGAAPASTPQLEPPMPTQFSAPRQRQSAGPVTESTSQRAPATLARRVPGASVSAADRSIPRGLGVADHDPERARERLKQIEYGVARALAQLKEDTPPGGALAQSGS